MVERYQLIGSLLRRRLLLVLELVAAAMEAPVERWEESPMAFFKSAGISVTLQL